MRILFTGGGSGGHTCPIVAVKRALEKHYEREHMRFLYIGPDGFAANTLKPEGVKCKFLLAGKLRRYFSVFNFIDLIKVPVGLLQSLWYLFCFMPDVIFSKGGYGSIPGVFAGWLYRIPVIIHESDSIPGLANRISAKFAKKIIVSFEDTKKYFSKQKQKLILLGNPIREELIRGNREEGKNLFKLSLEKPVVLIMGGSQGAQKINEIVLNSLPRLLEKCEIIHICGEKNFKSIEKEVSLLILNTNRTRYHLYPFLDEDKLKHAYAVSNIVVSRASAGAVFEIAALEKPSILIPLSNAASNHQTKNARALVEVGGTITLEEENLTINMFLDAVFGLLDNPQKAKKMGEKAKSFYKPDANQKIAEEILKLCR